jgi:hypothetical protein
LSREASSMTLTMPAALAQHLYPFHYAEPVLAFHPWAFPWALVKHSQTLSSTVVGACSRPALRAPRSPISLIRQPRLVYFAAVQGAVRYARLYPSGRHREDDQVGVLKVRITREVVDSALEDNEWKSLGVWENVTPHTFVMPYPASVLSGIRSMMLAPEDMKMNLAPLGMSGTQAWKRARDPRVYQGVSEQDA